MEEGSVKFYKYQGAGNDFILVNNVDGSYDDFCSKEKQLRRICHRQFGVGADGFIEIKIKEGYDFEVVYYNSDGRKGTFCGNGSRCAVAFAYKNGLFEGQGHFLASDGSHYATLTEFTPFHHEIALKFADIEYDQIGFLPDSDIYTIDTGSPHFVTFVNDLDTYDVQGQGQILSMKKTLWHGGQNHNVNFVQIDDGRISVRTYERGVEEETLACGTGSVATVLVLSYLKRIQDTSVVSIQTRGGVLKVFFKKHAEKWTDIFLVGPAVQVFSGTYRTSTSWEPLP